jgi:hypothetical protein
MKKILTGLMIALMVVTFATSAFATANTCTSSTGTKTGTDATFYVTYRPAQVKEGVILYLKFTQGTAETLTLTFSTINNGLSTTDQYKYPMLTGSALSAYTMTIATTGNYRIPLPMIHADSKIVLTVVFSAAAQGGVVVANFVEP